MKKTNAARLLDRLNIAYELKEYEVDENDLSAGYVAQKVGVPLEQTFKTLVLKGDKTGVMVVCLPGGGEVNLKKAAAVSGNKKVELVPLKEVLGLTGYIRGGVSPLGMKKKYPVYLDNSAFQHSFIMISAGQRGLQILLKPEDLALAVQAIRGDLT
jgi:Cys-tRNA(Pro)/Cys-tRNA(Cys) deacylase